MFSEDNDYFDASPCVIFGRLRFTLLYFLVTDQTMLLNRNLYYTFPVNILITNDILFSRFVYFIEGLNKSFILNLKLFR